MKFYGSIAAGVCTIWIRFEPDMDSNIVEVLNK